ncbi:MAG: sulfatase-like hydrolase/transferase [Acidobacteriia bacterium]|nr:sulfatase-like hydrolase/transferase [Terriglobia bacterium]
MDQLRLTRRNLLSLPLAAAAPSRPNIIFVLVDDLRQDELGCYGHPFASTPHADRLAREGARFLNAFAVTPLCSPSRASFLTGQYPHANGITDNTSRARQSHQLMTWPRRLHEAGYQTSFIGKWHMGNDDSPRPGFDHWVSFPGQGQCIDPPLNVNGAAVQTRGYITDLLTDHAVDFLKRKRRSPFCLYLAHKAVHPNIVQRDDGSVAGTSVDDPDSFIPAERHRNLYVGKTLPRRPNYGKPPAGKPALERSINGLKPLGPQTATPDATILNRMRMMKAVDESLGRILASVPNLDETMVIFTSDHGYFYGEHGLDAERRLAYEEAIRIPMLIRYPAMFRAGSRPEDFMLSIDIANLCLRQQLPRRRDDFLIEYYSDTVFPRIRNMGYHAVRTQDWKYIQYRELKGMDELYNLRKDPYEMNNLIHQDKSALAAMRQRLDRLRKETGA